MRNNVNMDSKFIPINSNINSFERYKKSHSIKRVYNKNIYPKDYIEYDFSIFYEFENFKNGLLENADDSLAKTYSNDFIIIKNDIEKISTQLNQNIKKVLKKKYNINYDIKKFSFKGIGKRLFSTTEETNISNLFSENTITFITLPFQYYRIFLHADNTGNSKYVYYRDMEMRLFDESSEIQSKIKKLLEQMKHRPNNSVAVFLCDGELDFTKNQIFEKEFKENCFTKINLNEINTKKVIKYYKYMLQEKHLDKNLIKNLMQFYNSIIVDNNIFKNLSVNTRNLDLIFNKWLCELQFQNGEIDEATYKNNLINNTFGIEQLDRMIGQKKIKDKIEKICITSIVENIKKNDIETLKKNIHNFFFFGNPGTGKTEIARILTKILYDYGIIHNKNVCEVSVNDLSSSWVGHTTEVCTQKIEEAIGGVLFIDEAYSLKNSEHGKEAIDTLVKEIECLQDRLVIIMAGYKAEMTELIEVNHGLKSRISNCFDFEDYNLDELISIFNKQIKEQGYILAKGCNEKLKEIFTNALGNKNFGNGRFVRNLIINILENQHLRCYKIFNSNNSIISNKDKRIELFYTIIPEDIEYDINNFNINIKEKIGFTA